MAKEQTPKPPDDEKGLLQAIERCKNPATLKALAQQYCRDRWKALREKGAALLEEARLTELYAKAILDLNRQKKLSKTWRAQSRRCRKAFNQVSAERDAKQTILDDTAQERKEAVLALGELQHKHNRLTDVAKEALFVLEREQLDHELQGKLQVAICNLPDTKEDKPGGE